MKKIFTLAAAVLASFSLWAVDPTYESSEWAKQADAEAALGKHGNVTLAQSGLSYGNLGSNGSFYYVAVGQNLKSSDSDWKYFSIVADENYFIDSVSVWYCENGSNETNVAWIGWGEGETPAKKSLAHGETAGTKGSKKLADAKWVTIDAHTYDIQTMYLSRSIREFQDAEEKNISNFGKSQSFNILGFKVWLRSTCTNPELTVSPTEGTGFIGDPIDITVSSKNQSKPINSAVTVDGVAAVYGTDYTCSVSTGLVQATPLKAGTFEITFSQASNGTYCDAKESATFVISEKTPVASVTIDGPTAGVIGKKLTYTATAEGATAYQWLVDGIDANNNAATFVYTAVKGNHSIVCKARNKFNVQDEEETWVESAPIALTVTKLCGELIKAVYDPSSKTSTVTGVVGGTADRNTQDNGKLGSNGHYYGVKLTSGSFMAGDVVTVVASLLNGGNNATIYADKTGTTLLGSKEFDTESLSAEITLTTSADVVYLYRKDGGCNPNIASLSVTRSCEDSKDASIKSLTINGAEVEEKEGVFAYTVSAKENLAQVAVAYTIHPLATATPASGFNVEVPTAGDPANTQVITVTAEDGTKKAYTVSVAKAAALNNDATLKALSVEGFELNKAFDPEVIEYTITKAYEAELPAVSKVTATANDANATVNVAYNELVENEILVQVLAEDGETAKTYSIKVYSAEAIKSLSRVLFSNGFDAFIDNTNRTVKAFYLQGEEAPTAIVTAGANCTAGEIADGKIVVTGADKSLAEYAVTLEAVAPNTNTVEETAEAGVFDGTETWVKSGLYLGNAAGFNEGKYVLRRQLKSGDKADDQRVIAGWVRAYFFVGNASKLELANTANKKVKYAVDGGEYTESEANPLVILLNEGNHMIEVVTNQSSGDCNLSAPKLVKRTATALGNTEAEAKAVKVVRDGQLLIMKNGVLYNAQGAVVK